MQPRALQVDQVPERPRDRLEPVVVDEADRVRLGVEHGLVGVDVVEVVEELGGPADEHVAQGRVEIGAGSAAAPARPPRRLLRGG